MSLLTENVSSAYEVPTNTVEHKKYDLLPHCKYNDGVACGETNRNCKQCGWNPIVSEMRKQAIFLGDKHFLRFRERDFGSVEELLDAVRNA